MSTRSNRLSEAVPTCTHNLCFEQKQEKYHNFSSENYRFYSCEKSLYIAKACCRNVSVSEFGARRISDGYKNNFPCLFAELF